MLVVVMKTLLATEVHRDVKYSNSTVTFYTAAPAITNPHFMVKTVHVIASYDFSTSSGIAVMISTVALAPANTTATCSKASILSCD